MIVSLSTCIELNPAIGTPSLLAVINQSRLSRRPLIQIQRKENGEFSYD